MPCSVTVNFSTLSTVAVDTVASIAASMGSSRATQNIAKPACYAPAQSAMHHLPFKHLVTQMHVCAS